MKKLICFLMALMLAFSLVACTKVQPPTQPQETNPPEETYPTFVMEIPEIGIEPVVDQNNTRYFNGSLEKAFLLDTAEKLVDYSPLIVAGKCISQENVYHMELHTLSQIEITHVFFGDARIGDVISVIEMGGRDTSGNYDQHMYEEKDFFTGKRLPDDYRIVTGYEGYFPLREGDEVLLFLSETTGFQGELWYVTVDASDGKLYLQESGAYQQPLPSSTDELKFDTEGLQGGTGAPPLGGGTLTITIDQLMALCEEKTQGVGEVVNEEEAPEGASQ